MDNSKIQGLRIEVRQTGNPTTQIESLEKAIKIFKRKVEKEGILRIIKERKVFTKPSMLEHIRIGKIQRINELKRKEKEDRKRKR